ncbi:unnamed protein product [Porites lobata]|uniref:t-SNARE coiled-coil homology domain-containing protein n=1 Tax=Porites lobata TaxID=104759 RepID=A0ABN8QI73_9CNID|nr:unnamed protein product [Porites lobata]
MPPKRSKKRTLVSSSEEEISAHMLVDDAILKDIQKKLEKLDMLDKINNQLSTIKHDIANIKSNVTELEKGLNAVNDNVAEMKSEGDNCVGFHTRLHSLAHGLGNIVWIRRN